MWDSRYNTKHIRDVAVDTSDAIEARWKRKGELGGIPSGLANIDAQLDGFSNQLYIIAGRPSMGKSVLMKDCLLGAAKSGHAAHLVNIEDGNINTCKRMISSYSGIDLWKLNKGHLGSGDFGGISRAIADLASYEITMNDSTCYVEPIEGSIREAIDNGSQIIFLDYLQLMQTSDRKGHKRLEEIGVICRTLKEISKSIPVVVTAQLNRGVETRDNKRPMMADLRDSGEIEQHADVILLLYREGYYTKDSTDDKAELIIGKGRNIATGTISLTFNAEQVCFEDRQDAF